MERPMASRHDFARRLADLSLSHRDRAIALLWYYDYSQDFDERTPAELAADLSDERFPRPNVTRLRNDLRASRKVVRGSRPDSYRLDIRRKSTLDDEYLPLLGAKAAEVTGSILDPVLVKGTRRYIEQLVFEINGTYEYGFYDGTASLCRRLMESLLIEVYIHQHRGSEIRQGTSFLGLEKLISHVQQDSTVILARNSPKTMQELKRLGDTASHDRVYITQKDDIDDIKPRIRRLVQELLSLSGIVH